MKKYYKLFKESLDNTMSCDILYFYYNFLDKAGIDSESITFASHIWLVCVGLNDLQFRFYQVVAINKYKPCLCRYHNKETFSFLLNCHYNSPEDYLKIIKEVSLNYYDFDVKNKKQYVI